MLANKLGFKLVVQVKFYRDVWKKIYLLVVDCFIETLDIKLFGEKPKFNQKVNKKFYNF